MMQTPYLVIPVLLICTGIYLGSITLVKAGILSHANHRKIWNTLLLLSFIVACSLGILLAVRINYKLDWPWLESMLKWHVDAGILMSFTAIVHLGWHLSYYRNIFSNLNHSSDRKPPVAQVDEPQNKGRELNTKAFLLGFFTMVVQVLLIREITTVFQGNEVMMAWTLATWMFLTGVGSWLGRSSRKEASTINRIFLLTAFLPPLAVLLMNLGRNQLFLPGTLVHPLWFIVMMLVLLAPLCILSGYAFVLLIKADDRDNRRFALVYAMETAGSLIGGVAVSFLLTRWFSVMESLLIASLAVVGTLWALHREKPLQVALIVLVTLLTLFFLFPLDLHIKSFLFNNQKVVATHETPFGNVTVGSLGDEKTVYENGSALFTTGDAIVSEEYVHFALLQHRKPRKVLLISGDLNALSAEVLKYPAITRLGYVEINPGLTKLISRYRETPGDERIEIIPGDGRRFIMKTNETWDVIVVGVPDPSSLQLNRYYTDSFISFLKRRLENDGVVIYGLSPSGNYISPEKSSMEASLYHTLSGHFKHIRIIPGERDYYLASDDTLSARPGELSAIRGIGGSYVNADYMDDSSLEARGDTILHRIIHTPSVNTDLKPLPVYYHTLRYLSQFMGHNYHFLLIPVALLLLILLRMNPVSTGMFVTGLTASSAEIILIFWFQVVFGNLYMAIGLIFALFMGGLALGSVIGKQTTTGRRHFLAGQLMLAGSMLLLPLLWKAEGSSISPVVLWLIFIPALLIPSLLTGFQYVTTTRNYPADNLCSAATVYAADLWGSALGALIIATLLIPLAGVFASCIMMAGLNLMVVLLNIVRKQN